MAASAQSVPELRRYQLHLLRERKLALGTVENRISALRFLYKKTLKRHDLAFDDLPFPKQPRSSPTVLSQEEVTRLLEAPPQPHASLNDGASSPP